MSEDEHSKETSGKNFFTTLPGLITATAGLITAIGGFILILNKAGCMMREDTNDAGTQHTSQTIDTTGNSENMEDRSHNILYSPTEINVILKGVVFKITSANISTLPNKELVLNLKTKCVNNSKYEYHFYAYNMQVSIGEDKYAIEPSSPSDGYQSIPAMSFKALEYNFKLPSDTSKFNLVISEEKEEMGFSTFTIE